MSEKLTEQQRTAVYNRGGKLLVSAAAGSGKTKVLVDRLMTYLTDEMRPANIDDFLIITYTKAAAAELRGKIAAKITERIAQDPSNRHMQQQMQRLYLAKISTVHAFCSDLLKEFAYRLDISSDFRMTDESEEIELQTAAIEQVLEAAYSGNDADFFAFIDTQGLGRSDRLIPEIIFDVYQKSRCHLNPDQWLSDCISATDTQELRGVEDTVWGQYLISDLRQYLMMQIEAISGCATAADADGNMEKPAALLWEIVDQLRNLTNCVTWNEIIRNKDIDYGRLTFGKKCENMDLINQIKSIRDDCKKGVAKRLEGFANPSEQVLKDMEISSSAMRGLINVVRQFAQVYDSMKRSRRILDFSDLEHKALDLLVGKSRITPTHLAEEVGARFREVMVDEYQDSNAVQDKIFSALTQNSQNCFMVGDVKQSIYQFRLADPDIFLQKYKQYELADNALPGVGRKVMLSKNFRSSQGVVSAVNDVFSTCMSESVGGLEYGPDEALYEGLPHISLGEREVELYGIDVQHDTYHEEAEFVAGRIVELLGGEHMVRENDQLRPIKPDDIVILLRSPGSVGSIYQNALESRGVSCTTGNGSDLLQSEEIIVFRALLQVIHNPLQDIPLLSAVTSRVVGLTADDMACLRTGKRDVSIYASLKNSKIHQAEAFLELLKKLRVAAGNMTLTQLLNYVLQETKLDSIYGAMKDGYSRLENIHSFCQLAASFETNAQGGLGRFLDYLNALEEKGVVMGEEGVAGAVRIMSIHKSKGLEFPVVFLCGLSKGFNKDDSRAPVLADRVLGLGLCCADMKNRIKYPTIAKKAIGEKKVRDMISEEMRVLYVAMTRARDRLIMTYAHKDLEKKLSDIAYRMDLSPSLLLTSDVSCAGDWVLLSALKRKEARCMLPDDFAPKEMLPCTDPWLIRCVSINKATSEIIESAVIEEPTLDETDIVLLEKHLSYQYPFVTATQTPSKQTATQLKGRIKDSEVSENTGKYPDYQFRKPSFISSDQDRTRFGKLMHRVMQYIRFDVCTDLKSVSEEIARLASAGFITEEERDLVDVEKIYTLFTTSTGVKLKHSENVLREFKFSILDDANNYGESLSGEMVLLQGVVDCAVLEEDGIVVIDFKTDQVAENTVNNVLDKYRNQVNVYAHALERIYNKRVKQSLVYFFNLGKFFEV